MSYGSRSGGGESYTVVKEERELPLTAESFRDLLSALGDDRDAAAARYERIRGRLIKYFAWERCPYPEEHADEVFDRVARRISAGEQLEKPESYFYGVARMLAKEIGSDFQRRAMLLEELGRLAASVSRSTGDITEKKERCLRGCLERLPAKSRAFILRYYEGDTRARIEGRQALAQELGIPLNALRNRALRLRERIESCVRKCVQTEFPHDISGNGATSDRRRNGG